ncbi:MAG: SPOR domain-containing protein, partial [Magnetococcales bacterium]|nr:SPOR domain-containing protein [Magnetococcales bacterium]
ATREKTNPATDPSATGPEPTQPETRTPEEVNHPAHPAPAVKGNDLQERRAEPVKRPSIPPIPGIAALALPPGATPPQPPRPAVEEPPEKLIPAEASYTVQLGAFSSEEKANALITKLTA